MYTCIHIHAIHTRAHTHHAHTHTTSTRLCDTASIWSSGASIRNSTLSTPARLWLDFATATAVTTAVPVPAASPSRRGCSALTPSMMILFMLSLGEMLSAIVCRNVLRTGPMYTSIHIHTYVCVYYVCVCVCVCVCVHTDELLWGHGRA
jgi:hypothetical protein